MASDDDTAVLVVDDEQAVADVYSEWLSESYTVKTAYGGNEALDRLDSSIDIVLLDRQMPVLSGEQVLETIRERNVECQVALVTGVPMDYESLPLAFDDYLQKPVAKSDLHTLVESLRIRMDYCDTIQEYFRLVSKRVALQTAKDGDEFAAHPTVAELDAEIAALRAEVDGLLAEFSDAEYEALFRAFSRENCAESERGLG